MPSASLSAWPHTLTSVPESLIAYLSTGFWSDAWLTGVGAMVVHVDGLEAVAPLDTGGGGVGGVKRELIGGETEPMWFTTATPMGVPA